MQSTVGPWDEPWIFALLCWRIRSSLFPRSYLLVLQSLEAEFLGEEKQQNQIKGSWGAELEEKVYLYLFSRLIKMWCPSSSQLNVSCVLNLCLWLYDVVHHIRVSCFIEHNLLSYSLFGLRNVKIVSQVSWSKRSKRRIEALLGSKFVWLRYEPF